MTRAASADVVIVGSGVCGLLVARELVRAGHETLVVERGGMKPHEQQLADDEHAASLPTAEPNHETHPDVPAWPWDYVYGVGGSTLHWAGVTPRFLPSDFRMGSEFGVGRDWPFGYDELEPFYRRAEEALAVAGGENAFLPGSRRYPHPPHPYAPVDNLLRDRLKPYFPLPQARPTGSVGGRAACCGSARCRLCPVDARYSGLHTLGDERLLDRDGFTLREGTIVARLRPGGRRIQSLECVDPDGERSTIRAGTVVLAANGIENASILLRSGLDGQDVGRWLFDHQGHVIKFELGREAGHGYGGSLATGVSYAWADGDFRRERGSLLLYPYNPGLRIADEAIQAAAAGRDGRETRQELLRRFQHTLVLDSLAEDVPRRERFVELSPRKDRFGLPLNRIAYPVDSDYVARAYRFLERDLARRLGGIRTGRGIRTRSSSGGHQLGTCHMGESSGVVDPNLRHHDHQNLYVAGGSAFPTYSASHPTLTIAALAIRLGEHLAALRR